jgi:hypothetical protein
MALTKVSAGVLNIDDLYGFRNRLINGGFEVWQRGTARTYSTSYLADRWTAGLGFQAGAHQQVSISSPPSGLTSQYALRSSSSTTGENAGGTRMSSNQKIEYQNCYDLANSAVTLSGWIRCSNTSFTASSGSYSSLTIRIQTNTTTTDSATSADTGDGNITPISFSGGVISGGSNIQWTSGNFPTTWTYFTFTGIAPANLKNLSVRFETINLANTSVAGSEWYEVAELQLEKGRVATPFERRPYGTELALCQRYYYKTSGGPTGGRITQAGYAISTTVARVSNVFPVPMRTSPTALEQSGTAGQYSITGFGNVRVTCSAVPTYADAQTNHATTAFTVSSGLTAWTAGQGAAENVTTPSATVAYLAWSAEL